MSLTPDASLNDAQRRAVTHEGSHLLVVAGPGSGKTRVLTHRIAHLVKTGVSPREILAVTFTNKAAGEIRSRLSQLVGDETAKDMWAGTFHSMCARLLRYEHQSLLLPRQFQILDSNDSQRVVANLVREYNLADDAKNAMSLARELRDQFSYVKNTMRDSSEFLEPGQATLYGAYVQRLQKMQALDFDDLLLFTLRFLENKDSPQAARWRGRFRHVLVDEFQDTNAVQLALVKRFAESGLVTAVGDAAQSIYSWRGADHTVLDRFAAEFSPATVVMLGENYRSTPQIVQTCQSILDADLDAPYRLELSTSNPPGTPVQARECDDDRDEANYIASRIEASSIPASKQAVLVRTAAQTRSIEDEFVSRRIPYVVVGGLRFYDRAEVRDALSFLRAASYPCDVVSFQRAVAAPKRGVGDKTVAEIAAHALELGSLELALAGHTGRAAKALGEFAEILSQITASALTPDAQQSGPASAVQTVIDKAMRAHWAKDQDSQGRMENLEQLQAAAESFTKGNTVDGQVVSELDGRSQLLAFLEHVALIAAVDEGKAECVQVMTMHAAKGREFQSVFVAGVEEEILPHVRSQSSHADLQEERRLFYVACSRAEQLLSITWCRSRFLFGKHRDQTPSRFLGDLPTDPTILVRTRSANRKAPWTQNHRSRPVGTGSWAETASQPRPLAQAVVRSNQPSDSPRLSLQEASPGAVVAHVSFGDGEVLSVNGDSVTIVFSGTKRTLSLSLAPMSLKK